MGNVLDPGNWLKLYGNYLFTLAIMKTGNKELAEDLLQETFLSAVKAKESFKGNSNEKTWLAAILKNKIIDHYRKKKCIERSRGLPGQYKTNFSCFFF